MTMIRIKPPGYFGRVVDEGRLQSFLDYGLETAPEAPGPVVGWSVEPGMEPGEIKFTIPDVPDPKDAVYYGDGDGVTLDLVWYYGDEALSLDASAAGEYTVSLPDEYWGETIDVSLWSVASAGAGEATTLSVTVTPSPENLPAGGPVAPVATIYAGDADGEVVFDVLTLDADYGDAVVGGDGLGTEGVLEYRVDNGAWVELIDPEATGEVSAFVIEPYWGRAITVDLRRRNAEGFGGDFTSQTIVFAGDLHITESVDLLGSPVDLSGDPVIIYLKEA